MNLFYLKHRYKVIMKNIYICALENVCFFPKQLIEPLPLRWSRLNIPPKESVTSGTLTVEPP